MTIGITLALLAAVGYGTADFVGGAGARRAPTMSIVFIGQVTGAVAMPPGVALASPGTPTLAHAAWALLAGFGSATGSIPVARVVAGSHGGRRPDVRCRRGRAPGAGRARQWRSTGHPRLDRPRPRLPGMGWSSRQVADGTETSAADRGAFVDGLLGGLGFGVLFVALGQYPESAGTLPLALSQLTGALVTVVVSTVLVRSGSHQPPRRAGRASGLLGVSAPSPSSKPATSPTSVWSRCSPRSTRPSRCCWPAPCSASASAPGSASGCCSAPRPWG